MSDGRAQLGPEALLAWCAAHGGAARLLRPGVPTPTVPEAAAAVGVARDRVLKSLVLWVDGAPTLVIAAGEDRLVYPKLAAAFGTSRRRVRLASADEALELTGYPVGAMPPFGHRARRQTRQHDRPSDRSPLRRCIDPLPEEPWMTHTAPRPRTTRRAPWRAVVLFALAPFAVAQVGQPVPAFLEALALTPAATEAAAGAEGAPTMVVTDQGRSFSLTTRGSALYAVAGEALFDAEAIAEAASVIAVATGYGDGIEDPVRIFFEQNLASLAGAGPRTIPVEAFLLDLEVRGDGPPFEVAWSLALAEVDEAAFPEARHVKGPADARYVIREFSDLQCPFCARYAAEMLPALEAELLPRGDVRFEYHHFPLVSIHANAFRAAEATECVVDANPDDADAFWTYSDALFERMQAWGSLGDPDAYFANLAGQVGLPGAGVAACLAAGTHTAAVSAATDAAAALGLSGTPTVFVGPYRLQEFNRVQGYLDTFALIDAFADAE